MNYFNYFTEIELRFQQRRGSLLMLSTLDWALIETWREAGIPLEAVLRGIDAAFDKHDAQRLRAGARRQRRVNGLAWCAQAVLEATEQGREAAVGSAASSAWSASRDSGFDPERIARYLTANAAQLRAARLPPGAAATAGQAVDRLTQLAATLRGAPAPEAADAPPSAPPQAGGASPQRSEGQGSAAYDANGPAASLEHLDRTLTVLEERLVAALLAATPEAGITALREQADRELAPYRSRMQAHQIKQIQQQFLQKRLLQMHSLPRLSLFYMPHEDG
jgi:hypothetical protein